MVHHREGLATRKLSEADHQAARLAGLRLYLEKHHPRAGAVSTPMFALAHRLRARKRRASG